MGELDLLVEEIFMNIARHSYPEGAPGVGKRHLFGPEPGELAVEFGDQGVEFNPLTANPPDLTLDLAHRPVGGLGIFLLRTFADSLSYRREQGWNRLTLRDLGEAVIHVGCILARCFGSRWLWCR